MNYTLYLRTEQGDFFLQKAGCPEDLQKSHATVQRWIGQMSLTVKNANSALLVIAKGNYATHDARYIAGGRRVWRPITELELQRIRDPLPAPDPSANAKDWQGTFHRLPAPQPDQM